MIRTFNQNYDFATPPAVGDGSGIALYKNPKLNLSVVNKYGLSVDSSAKYNSMYYDVDVLYANGTTASSNFETGLKNPVYDFTYEKNTGVFSSPQRSYSLVFKVNETSPPLVSSGKYTVYHNEAQISSISGVTDGTLVGDVRNLTGTIDIDLIMLSNDYYRTSKFEIYTGSSSSFAVVTGTGAGANLMKTVSVFDQKANYTLTIRDGEQPANGDYYFYKILPYDDFGSGVLYSSPPISGLMYAATQPLFSLNNVTGKNFVMINDGNYVVNTFHSGVIVGASYNVLDYVLNVSGNIVSGGWYDQGVGEDFAQNQTQYFKTIKYLAQTTDASGNVSNREILVTDNSTSLGSVSRTGLLHSEYAVSDSSQSAQFLVSGSGYSNGSGAILLMAKLSNPNGSYKLLRTIM